MRYIDIKNINIPDNWVALARERFRNTNRTLWSFFKADFEGIVGKKCWYSESLNNGANNDIDHFRPKSDEVKEFNEKNAELEDSVWLQIDSNARIGYPFLELEFSNYRYACTFVNSPHIGKNDKTRGKSNFFPLQTNSPQANAISNISTEVSCLLDPCNEIDPQYLTFNNLGNIEPHISLLNTSWEYCRVKVSIEIYHLHYYHFERKRLELWNECKNHINMANDLRAKVPFLEEHFSYYISGLTKKIGKKSEFSAVAIDCIQHYKKIEENGIRPYEWLENIFPNNILLK